MTVTVPKAANGVKKDAANWVPVLEERVHKPRRLRVVCIGAGFSVLTLAYKVKHDSKFSEFVDLVIYEKNADVGGTWYENRYPGVACDVPAHIYTFPFAPNPDWTAFYSSGQEIFEYIKATATKFKLDENITLQSRVVSTTWDEDSSKWKLRIDQKGRTIEDEADVLVNGSGILNNWRWPKIPGLDSFGGTLIHSASWNPDCDWSGKKVAIIGNGSSAIQILPQMQPNAAKLVTYIRTPTWITTNFAAEFTPEGKNYSYTEEEKQKFRSSPDELLSLRRRIEHSFNQYFFAFMSDSPQQAFLHDFFKKEMQARLRNDANLCAKLIPEWRVGCRRITPGDGYLEALQQSNVKIEFDGINEITKSGIKTKDSEEDFDIIVCATGFDVSFSPSWDFTGRQGKKLADLWKDRPEAYFGVCAPEMPNYFIFNGPNCPIGHGSLMAVIDVTADYILKWCQKIASEDIRSVCVKHQAVDDYNVYSQEFLKRTVWSSGCRSWYKNGQIDGPITAMYAGSTIHYREMLDTIRSEDFDFLYRSPNRFRFMGKGITLREEKGENLAFYLT